MQINNLQYFLEQFTFHIKNLVMGKPSNLTYLGLVLNMYKTAETVCFVVRKTTQCCHTYSKITPSGLRFTHRNEDVEEVLQSGELRDELLHHFAEGLKNGVVINTRQVKAE